MEEQIHISRLIFFLVNSPLVIFSLGTDIFFLYCIAKPRGNSKRPKQPLKILLEYIMWCSILYAVFLMLTLTVEDHLTVEGSCLLWSIMQYLVHQSMSSYVWLNFYFFIHIVPVRCALLIWLKRNIKVATLIAFCLNLGILLNNYTVRMAFHLTEGPPLLCSTNDSVKLTPTGFTSPIFLFNQISFIITWVYMWTIFGFKIITSWTTFRYLQGHMRSVAKNGIPFPIELIVIMLACDIENKSG
ncbi:uncharacterized protein LOC133512508 [Syngnathoides biaculeatus]|uniref:uncharacterized protein LOC133512508 n=1 Tax=Syngnathoides biaculeatus TaxID=300417 RepID=UPI002ADD46BD|nr:uncharacterized protein LOC133512508 [Syngnathoides biaculeatus]